MTERPNVDRNAVLRALSAVQDPDLNQDIVSLGFVQNLEISGGVVSFSIVLTTPDGYVSCQGDVWSEHHHCGWTIPELEDYGFIHLHTSRMHYDNPHILVYDDLLFLKEVTNHGQRIEKVDAPA